MIKDKLLINGRYKTLKRLGVGGMGEVWQCEDTILNRKVALKFVNEAYSINNPKSTKILKDEARLGAKLIGHPNVVTILDYGIYEDKAISMKIYYIVMECVEGINLNTWINTYSKTIDKKTFYNINLFIAWEIVKSINYAHSKKILHRDIKPLNIFLSNMGYTKIGDFGISRFTEEATRTHTMWQFNTPAYCAPEQWNGEKPTAKTDVYQIGCTLYQLFTGKLPFNTDNLPSLMNAHLNSEPISPRRINSYISEELSDFIVQALEKKDEDRVALWAISDTISKEIQGKYNMEVDVHLSGADVQELVNEITEFTIDQLKEDKFNYTYLDFSEALSEAMQLILAGITNIEVNKIEGDSEEEVAVTETE